MPSCHTSAVVERMRSDGYTVNIKAVNYEFQKGGTQMMQIVR
jgi:hypothetical protein